MIARLFLGALVAAGAVVAAIAASGGTIDLLRSAGIVLPLLGAAAGVLIAGPGPGAAADLLRSGRSLSGRRAAAAEAVLGLARRALAWAALEGFLIRLVEMMKRLERREDVWPSLAWAMAPALAALVLHAAVLAPLGHALREAALGAVARDGADDEGGGDAPWSFRRFLAGGALTATSLIAFAPEAVLGPLFLDSAALIVAVFVPAGALLAGAPTGSFRRALAALRAPGPNAADICAAARCFAYLSGSLRRAAAVGASAGFVFLVKDWLDRMRYGPTLALALISVFWCAAGLLVLALPLEAAAERRTRLAAADSAEGLPGQG